MSYTVTVTREEGQWLADVPDVPGAHTFARTLPALDKAVREVIVLMDDLDDDAKIALTYDFQVDDDAVLTAAHVGSERVALAEKEAALHVETREAITALQANGYSVRDAAALLHVTPGRVSQLTN
ncbi:hypothetical protein LWF01_03040 [Saxibacter everestensis]|uniref:Antitoxin HicB n=1 Tax=Saxibacter everestensis TaxID=2909229 RepID=A0ABY8QUT4_9MICO|nr:hypothetical protein LWF01_03040 [Brevibacteriaceae bacterium ZFBP1038]